MDDDQDNAAEDCEEEEPCRGAGDSRDPNYDPAHRFEFIGEADGRSFYKCRHCNEGYEA